MCIEERQENNTPQLIKKRKRKGRAESKCTECKKQNKKEDKKDKEKNEI